VVASLAAASDNNNNNNTFLWRQYAYKCSMALPPVNIRTVYIYNNNSKF
jgi:hypothetical protein